MTSSRDGEAAVVQQPARAIVGHCPECQDVIVVINNYEVWPYITCRCGWKGPTTGVAHRTRYEREGRVKAGAPS